MGAQALRFSSLLNRLRMIGAKVVVSPPAPAGWVWLFGKKRGTFPFATGPMYPIKHRDGDQPIPAQMVEKILKVLALDAGECTQFWTITEHERIQDQPTERC